MNERNIETKQKDIWVDLYSKKATQWRGASNIPLGFNLDDVVLELGCGNGKTIDAISEGPLVIGLDYAYSAIEACKKAIRRENVELIIGDGLGLPLKDESIDATLCVHIFENLLLSGREALEREIWRTAKWNGKLFVRVFSEGDMRAKVGRSIEPGTVVRGNGIVYHYFREEELLALFGMWKCLSVRSISKPKRYSGNDYQRSEIELLFSKVQH